MLFYFLDVCHASSQKPVVLQTILPCLLQVLTLLAGNGVQEKSVCLNKILAIIRRLRATPGGSTLLSVLCVFKQTAAWYYGLEWLER